MEASADSRLDLFTVGEESPVPIGYGCIMSQTRSGHFGDERNFGLPEFETPNSGMVTFQHPKN
jgi:hypothetical protein